MDTVSSIQNPNPENPNPEKGPEPLSVADAPDYAKRSCNTCLGRGVVSYVVDKDTREERPCGCALRRYAREVVAKLKAKKAKAQKE